VPEQWLKLLDASRQGSGRTKRREECNDDYPQVESGDVVLRRLYGSYRTSLLVSILQELAAKK
jgi:hypothetical protein